MKYQKLFYIIIALLFVTSFNSCSHWSPKEWQSLENRDFTFSFFNYHNRKENKNTAFMFMKKFPVESVIEKLETKYCISIDSKEFQSFIREEKKEELKVAGMIFDDEFSWGQPEKNKNRIELHINRILGDDPSRLEYNNTYSLLVIHDDTVRARIYGEPDTLKEMPDDLISQLNKLHSLPCSEQHKKRKNLRKEMQKQKIEEILKGLSPEEQKLLKEKLKN